MTLATATPDGRPSARMVLLRGADERGFSFFTNYESRKARELEANPFAALVFFWHELERQVRIEGRVERVSADESDRYSRAGPRAPGSAPGPRPRARSSPVARVPGSAIPRIREPASRRNRPPSGQLGRLSPRARFDRILAGPSQPAARPITLYAAGRVELGSSSGLRLDHLRSDVRYGSLETAGRSGADATHWMFRTGGSV